MSAYHFQGRNQFMTFFNQAAGPVLAVLTAAALCACGGGGTDNGHNNPAVGGKLTISSAVPASHNTTVNADQSAMAIYVEMAAGMAPSDPYVCTLNYVQAPGADGASYTLQVVFHPVDKQALTVLLVTGERWGVVSAGDKMAPVPGVAINTQNHTLTFNNLALRAASSGTLDAAVLNGSLLAPPAGEARCVL